MGSKFWNKYVALILTAFLLFFNAASILPAAAAGNTSSADSVSTSAVALPNGAGKKVLFDNTHGQTAGAADWVIEGGFSDFADGLKADGFTVEQLERKIPYTFGEQAVTYDKLKNYDVFIIGEANIAYKKSEQDAMLEYVKNGGSIFFIADHYNADRNKNRWDASEVMNGYRRGAFDNPAKGMSTEEANSPAMQGLQSSDWLGTNFGIRFRYNALGDVNANDIVAADQSFGITQGVKAVAMHAGSTLAVLDPKKAKGLVYVPTNVSSWGPAVDQGVYNGGGRAEGAFAAISKLGAGKAAFIGDSSPVEDATPRYVREENGKSKTTYDGFKEVNDSTFLVQTVRWLANKESYTSFDQVQGLQLDQPTKLLPMEEPAASTEPQAEPWAKPDAGYKWYDPTTFKPGSYGASTNTNPDPGVKPVYKFVHQATLPSKQEFQIRVTVDQLQPGQTISGLKAGIYLAGGEQIAKFKSDDGTWSDYGYSPDINVTADAKGHASKDVTVQIKPGKQGAATLRLKQGTNNLVTESVNLADVPAEPLPGDKPPVPDQVSIQKARQAQDETLVTVEGVITSEPGAFGGQGFYLQDGTAGIYVFQSTAGYHAGDKISVTATKTTYNTEVELTNPVAIEKKGTADVPAPQVQAALNDDNQGRLIKLENVTVQNIAAVNPTGSFEFDAAGQNGTTRVRVDARTGVTLDAFKQQYQEGSKVNISGISSIFKGTYQLKPLSLNHFESAVVPDVTAPTTTVQVDGVSGENNYNTKDVTLTFTANDGEGSGVAKTEYRVNGGEWTTVEGTVTISTEGKNVVDYRSVDKAGNVEESKAIQVWVDKQAPTTTVQVDGVSGENNYNAKDVTLTFTANDGEGSGVAKTEYRVNGGEWTTVEGTVTISTEGKNVVDYRSVDKAGNVEESKAIQVWVDKQAPTTTVQVDGASGENNYNTKDVTLTFTANDGEGSGVAKTEYRVNGGEWTAVNGAVTISTEGKNAVDYRSIDKAGNVEETKTIQIWITKHPLQITINGPLSFYQTDEVIPASVKVESQVSSLKSVTYKLDGRSIDGLDKVSPLTLLPGKHTLVVTVEDKLGTKAQQTFVLETLIDIQHLDELITAGYNKEFIKNQGTASSLLAKVEAIQNANNKNEQLNKIKALENEVKAKMGKSITNSFGLLILMDLQSITYSELK
ncbi:OmpL47-type beta-barrel domain-containing protein [Microbacteriaceae bacterium 4G12]